MVYSILIGRFHGVSKILAPSRNKYGSELTPKPKKDFRNNMMMNYTLPEDLASVDL